MEPAKSRDHTERLLPAFGVHVERAPLTASVEGPAHLRPASLVVPGDASSAAFLVVAALILPDSVVMLENVLLNPERTAFVDVLCAMGGNVRVEVTHDEPEPVGTIVAASSQLHGIEVDPALVPALIDEVPALAVAAAHAKGTFTLTGASELRVKESDRLLALAEGLGRLGADVDEKSDGLVIRGGSPLRGGALVRSFGDHRIAMAMAIAALTASEETEVEKAECVAVSYPEFFEHLQRGTSA